MTALFFLGRGAREFLGKYYLSGFVILYEKSSVSKKIHLYVQFYLCSTRSSYKSFSPLHTHKKNAPLRPRAKSPRALTTLDSALLNKITHNNSSTTLEQDTFSIMGGGKNKSKADEEIQLSK